MRPVSEIFATLVNLPTVGLYLVAAVIAVSLFVLIFTRFTPYNDFVLIRSGHVPAAMIMASALVGFGLPLTVLIVHAVSLVDFAIWAGVAILIQCLAYAAARALLLGPVIEVTPSYSSISVARATLVVGLNLTFGLINAALLI